MAVYGIDFLGTEYYGIAPYVEFDANPFVVEPLGYGSLRLFWVPPSGDWSALRVVRNAYGAPDFETDGAVIAEFSSDAVSEVVDSGLTEGRFYYYSIFVLADETESWVRAAASMGLVIRDHDYRDTMFRWLPGWFQEQDNDKAAARTAFRPHGAGPLRRYLGAIAVGVNHVRTEYETLRDLRNPDDISGNLLPLLSQMVHVPVEPAIGMRRTRFWARDAVFLYRRKGTFTGIEGIASTITGWGSSVSYGPNMLKGSDAEFWALTTGTSIEDDPSRSNFADNDVTMTVVGSPWEVSSVPPGADLKHHAIHVTPDIHAARAEFRTPTGTGNVSVSIEWFDTDGMSIGVETSPDQEVVSVEWRSVEVSVGFVANDNPAYAVVRFNGDVDMRFRRAIFVRGSLAGWEPPSALRIDMLPARSNFVVNPSFEQSLVSWEITSGDGELSRTDSVYFNSNFSLRVSSASGDATVLTGGPYPISNPELRHTASIWTDAPNARIRIRWVDSNESVLRVTDWNGAETNEGTWVPLSVSDFPPSSQAHSAYIDVEVTAEESHFDAAMLEESDVRGEYFDGAVFGADYIWAGEAHQSASLYYPGRAIRHNRLQKLLPDYLPLGQAFRLNYVSGESFSSAAGTGTLGVDPLGTVSAG